MRQNLAMTDYGYNSVRSDSGGAGGTEEHTPADDHQGAWTSSENMVISLDPFNHNLETTPQHEQAVNDAEHMNGDQVGLFFAGMNT